MDLPPATPKRVITAVGSVVRIIMPPAASIIPVSLDDALSSDLLALHAAEVAEEVAAGQPERTFDEWLAGILRDLASNGWLP